MNALVVCPECNRKLKVPESAAGKAIRCPGCKTVIPAKKGMPPEKTKATNPQSPPREAVATAPTRPSAEIPTRTRPPIVEEGTEEEPSPRKKTRKGSSTGWIVGLIVGGAVLFLGLVGGGIGLIVYFVLNKTIPDAEWQSFSPPNGGCTILMPGTPVPQTMNMLGIPLTQYQVERKKENAVFELAIFDLPPQLLRPNVLQDIVNGSRNAVVAQTNGTVKSETSITLGNMEGREYQIQKERGTLITRTYLTKIGNTHRVYIVVAGGDFIKPNNGDAARFFDSFQVTSPATPPNLGGNPVAQGPQPPVINPPTVNPPAVNPPRPNPGSQRPRPNRQPKSSGMPGERAVWSETSGTQTLCLAFSPDSTLLAVGHWDKKVRLWDVAGGTDRHVIPTPDLGSVRAVAFHPDGSTLAAAGDDGKVILWDTASGKERSRFQVRHARPKEKFYATALQFHPEGKSVAVAVKTWGNTFPEVHLWNLENNTERAALRDFKEEVKKLTFIAEGAIVVLMPSSVRIWDTAANQIRREFKAEKPAGQFITSALSPDGQTLATMCQDKKLRMWRVSDGVCTQTWPVTVDLVRQNGCPFAFRPDGKYLAMRGLHGKGGFDSKIHFWDAKTGNELNVQGGPIFANIDVMAFSPDSTLLAWHSNEGPHLIELTSLLTNP